MDPFAILGVEPTFALDLKVVEKAHRDLSRALHPDKYGSAGASERQMALGKVIEVNEAARALKDPVRRAEALFARGGVPVGETEEPKPTPDFLMDILEQREALSDASDAKDRSAIAKLAASIRARMKTAEEALGSALVPSAAVESLRPQLPRLGELRYYRRFLDEVQIQIDRLDGVDSREA